MTKARKRPRTGDIRSNTWANSAPLTPGKSKEMSGKSPLNPCNLATISSTKVFVEDGVSYPAIRQYISFSKV